MTASLELFRTLADILDKLVLKVDSDLPKAEDIHTSIRRIGEYAAGLAHLPKERAKLEAQKASAEASVPAREKSLRTANHAVTMQEAKLKKLGERIDHHLNAQSDADDAPIEKPVLLDGKPLPTRKEIIEGLREEIFTAETEMTGLRGKAKKADANRKGALTRAANLTEEILIARWAIVDHEGRIEEIIKVLRKTISHLRNRQEKRDAKRAPMEIGEADIVEEVIVVPTDDDIVRQAAATHGIKLETSDDLEAARQLFLN